MMRPNLRAIKVAEALPIRLPEVVDTPKVSQRKLDEIKVAITRLDRIVGSAWMRSASIDQAASLFAQIAAAAAEGGKEMLK
jgi:hypothetical protein